VATGENQLADHPPHETAVHREPGFRRLWAANFSDEAGSQFSAMAMQVTAVSVLGASTLQLGVLTALGRLAYLVIGIPVGAWVDRWHKKHVMVLWGLVRAVAVASVAAAYLLGHLSIVQLMVVAAVVSVAAVFFDTAHTAILPALVGRRRVSEASARLQTTDSVMSVAGPGLAGMALARFPAPLLYLVSAATGLLSATFVASIRTEEPRRTAKEREPFLRSVRAGLSFVTSQVALRTHTISNALTNLGAGIFMAIAPAFALRDMGISPVLYGIAGMAGSGAAILTALMAMKIVRRWGDIRSMAVSHYLRLVAFLVLPLGAQTPLDGAIVLAMSDAAVSFIVVLNSVAASGVRARVTPMSMMGRVSAASRFVTLGVFPLGALLGGALGAHFSNASVLLLAAVFAGLSGLSVFLSPLRRLRSTPSEWETAADEAEARR
jgi:MFS family permease